MLAKTRPTITSLSILIAILIFAAGCLTSNLTYDKQIKLRTARLVQIKFIEGHWSGLDEEVRKNLRRLGFAIAQKGAAEPDAVLEIAVREYNKGRVVKYVDRNTGLPVNTNDLHQVVCKLHFTHFGSHYELEQTHYAPGKPPELLFEHLGNFWAALYKAAREYRPRTSPSFTEEHLDSVRKQMEERRLNEKRELATPTPTVAAQSKIPVSTPGSGKTAREPGAATPSVDVASQTKSLTNTANSATTTARAAFGSGTLHFGSDGALHYRVAFTGEYIVFDHVTNRGFKVSSGMTVVEFENAAKIAGVSYIKIGDTAIRVGHEIFYFNNEKLSEREQ